jgi:hypothetical protein
MELADPGDNAPSANRSIQQERTSQFVSKLSGPTAICLGVAVNHPEPACAAEFLPRGVTTREHFYLTLRALRAFALLRLLADGAGGFFVVMSSGRTVSFPTSRLGRGR